MSKLIGYPLGLIMWLVYQIVDNYALSLVFFTIITRILLFPISVKQQKSTAAMQSMQPKLDRLKKQYANNQQKMQEEQMKLYSDEGINPMGSCLPMLIQLPILYGVFDVVNRPITHILRFGTEIMDWAKKITIDYYTANEIKGTSISTITNRVELYVMKLVKLHPEQFSENPDFVEKVSGFKNTLFGFIDLGDIPTMHPEVWDKAAIGLVGIAVASGLFQLLMSVYSMVRQKKTGAGAGANPAMGSMNIMLLMFPVMSVVIAMSCPAGLGFYWAISALVGFVQQIILNRIYTPEYVATLVEKDKEKKKNKKKSGRPTMYQKYQEMLEQQGAAAGNVSSQVQKNKNNPDLAISDADYDDIDDADTEDENSGTSSAKPEKLSKSKQKDYERRIIAEARRRQAEKYGEEYIDED